MGMQYRLAPALCAALLLAGWVPANNASAQDSGARADSRVARARAAAYRSGHDFTELFDQLCTEIPPRRMRVNSGVLVPESRTAPSARTIPPQSDWYQKPSKVFDNLYYVGSRLQSMWAVTTSDGIILHDTGHDYMVEAEIVGGLRAVGLDPAQIKYVIISHGHADHYFGAKQLQDNYGASLIMSEADWDLVANDGNPAELKPRKDIAATDGMGLTLGDTTLTLYITPGHTPGTISTLFPLRDGNQWHLGALWGGTSVGYRYFQEPFDALGAYSASARRFQEIAAKARADVHLSSHTNYDNTLDKLNALKFRNSGDGHPFVSADAVERYQTIVSECAEATLGWLTNARRDGLSLRHSIESGLR
jgi:metallo-beta-lactamase class B